MAKTGTVALLKQAVEAAFSHLPKKGPKKVSWYAHFSESFCDRSAYFLYSFFFLHELCSICWVDL